MLGHLSVFLIKGLAGLGAVRRPVLVGSEQSGLATIRLTGRARDGRSGREAREQLAWAVAQRFGRVAVRLSDRVRKPLPVQAAVERLGNAAMPIEMAMQTPVSPRAGHYSVGLKPDWEQMALRTTSSAGCPAVPRVQVERAQVVPLQLRTLEPNSRRRSSWC